MSSLLFILFKIILKLILSLSLSLSIYMYVCIFFNENHPLICMKKIEGNMHLCHNRQKEKWYMCHKSSCKKIKMKWNPSYILWAVFVLFSYFFSFSFLHCHVQVVGSTINLNCAVLKKNTHNILISIII
jgi:hypothetical protein